MGSHECKVSNSSPCSTTHTEALLKISCTRYRACMHETVLQKRIRNGSAQQDSVKEENVIDHQHLRHMTVEPVNLLYCLFRMRSYRWRSPILWSMRGTPTELVRRSLQLKRKKRRMIHLHPKSQALSKQCGQPCPALRNKNGYSANML